MYVFIFLVNKVTEWPPIGKIAAHSAYEMFSWYKYLIVSLVFSHLGFWSGNLFLIAPFPDLCLLVPFYLTCLSSTLMQWCYKCMNSNVAGMDLKANSTLSISSFIYLIYGTCIKIKQYNSSPRK